MLQSFLTRFIICLFFLETICASQTYFVRHIIYNSDQSVRSDTFRKIFSDGLLILPNLEEGYEKFILYKMNDKDNESLYIQSELPYKDGRLHGTCKTWYSRDKTMLSDEYQNGEQHGLATAYFKDGRVWFYKFYKNGKNHGINILYNIDNNGVYYLWDVTQYINGEIISNIQFNSHGEITYTSDWI